MHKHLMKLALASLLSSSIVLAQSNAQPDLVARDIALSGGSQQLDERSFDAFGGDSSNDLEERGTEEDCDDEGRPATVYVTVTVDGGSPAGSGGAASPTSAGSAGAGGAGSSSVNNGACTTGCGEASSSVTDTALGTSTQPSATGGAGVVGGSSSAASTPLAGGSSMSTPTAGATSSSGEWDDWGDSGSGSSSSASGSGMPTSGAGGSDDGFSAGFRTTSGVPVAVSLAICLLTSVAAGVFATL